MKSLKYKRWRDRVIKHITEFGPSSTDVLYSEVRMRNSHPLSLMSASQVLSKDPRFVNLGLNGVGHFRTSNHYNTSTWGIRGVDDVEE